MSIDLPGNKLASIASVGGVFSPADAVTVLYVPDIDKLVALKNISTLAYSIHREKRTIIPLGRSYPKFVVRGSRTIGGTLNFIVQTEDPFFGILAESSVDSDFGLVYNPLPDQLSPMDVVITFMNEYGNSAFLRLYGIEIIDQGLVTNVSDSVLEYTNSFIARDFDVMVPSNAQWKLNKDDIYSKTAIILGNNAPGNNADYIGALNERAKLMVGIERMKAIQALSDDSNINQIGNIYYYKNRLLQMPAKIFYSNKSKQQDLIDSTDKRIADLNAIITQYNTTGMLPINVIEKWPSAYRREMINLGYMHASEL